MQEAQQRLGRWVALWRASGVRPSPELLTALIQVSILAWSMRMQLLREQNSDITSSSLGVMLSVCTTLYALISRKISTMQVGFRSVHLRLVEALVALPKTKYFCQSSCSQRLSGSQTRERRRTGT